MLKPGEYVRDLLQSEAGQKATARGWVKTRRDSKGVHFIQISDGSCFRDLQVVIDAGVIAADVLALVTTGACVEVQGELVASPAKGQRVELRTQALRVLGAADASYPLQKKGHSLEFLREIAHLRPRTNTHGAVFRVRNALSFAIHEFFQTRGFVQVHSPIITAIDAEGAGSMFGVTTLDLMNVPRIEAPPRSAGAVPLDAPPRSAGAVPLDAPPRSAGAVPLDAPPRSAGAVPLDAPPRSAGAVPPNAAGAVDYARDFFGKPTYLTVSGQLEAEIFALAFSNVYTFGPTFRAEPSNTARHLAEFWMIEPEIAFSDLADDMRLAEDFLKQVIQRVMERCQSDLEFFNERIDDSVLSTLEHVASAQFEHLTYTEAITLLEAANRSWEFPVHWGVDLQSEHERYLTEEKIGRPVILTDYPKAIKAFYMRDNDDGRTVRAMDVLVPRIGEIIGGSQREERYDVLREKIRAHDLSEDAYGWYLDLRKYGSAPHAGFGLGLERMLMYLTGMKNIRDVIPFPRAPGACEF